MRRQMNTRLHSRTTAKLFQICRATEYKYAITKLLFRKTEQSRTLSLPDLNYLPCVTNLPCMPRHICDMLLRPITFLSWKTFIRTIDGEIVMKHYHYRRRKATLRPQRGLSAALRHMKQSKRKKTCCTRAPFSIVFTTTQKHYRNPTNITPCIKWCKTRNRTTA